MPPIAFAIVRTLDAHATPYTDKLERIKDLVFQDTLETRTVVEEIGLTFICGSLFSMLHSVSRFLACFFFISGGILLKSNRQCWVASVITE